MACVLFGGSIFVFNMLLFLKRITRMIIESEHLEGQLKLLRDAGFDLVQGYYFSKPVPAEEFEKLIEKEPEII